MAPVSRTICAAALSLLCLCRAVISTEHFSTLTLFNNELRKQGCSSLSELEDYAADCGKASVFVCSLPRPSALLLLSLWSRLAKLLTLGR